MHDIGVGICEPSRDVVPSADVTPADVATHGHARQTESERRRESGEDCVRLFTYGQLVDDDSHLMAAGHLTMGEIDHMAEQAPARRAQDMQDFERPA